MKYKLKFYKMLLFVLIILTLLVGVMIAEKYIVMDMIEKETQEVLANINLEAEKNNNEPIKEIKQEIKGNKVVGIIGIPKIDLEYPILEKTTVESLKLSITKFWGNRINEIGNVALAGHNNLNGTMFGKVDSLEKGDVIELTDIQIVTLKYEVFDKYVIDPNDINCIFPVEENTREVTLITCINGDNNRLIIKAREIR